MISYAILILYGIKRTENRNMLPEPMEGRAAISCSKSFCKEEYGRLIAWASVSLPPEDFEKLPSWREVKDCLPRQCRNVAAIRTSRGKITIPS